MWDLATGRALATLQGHAASVTGGVVTPDGQRVVSASADDTLKVWDLATGRVLATLEGHTASVTGCAVTPDGQRVVSVSFDHTLKVWDLASRACLLTHRANAVYTAVTATATTIIAGDAVGAVWFLEWPSSHHRERSNPGSHNPAQVPSLLPRGR